MQHSGVPAQTAPLRAVEPEQRKRAGRLALTILAASDFDHNLVSVFSVGSGGSLSHVPVTTGQGLDAALRVLEAQGAYGAPSATGWCCLWRSPVVANKVTLLVMGWHWVALPPLLSWSGSVVTTWRLLACGGRHGRGLGVDDGAEAEYPAGVLTCCAEKSRGCASPEMGDDGCTGRGTVDCRLV